MGRGANQKYTDRAQADLSCGPFMFEGSRIFRLFAHRNNDSLLNNVQFERESLLNQYCDEIRPNK